MLKTPDWAAGAEYLREHAPELIPLIDRFPVCELKPCLLYTSPSPRD